MWSTDQGVVVKIDALAADGDTKERLKMDLTELKMGPQDPQLFEIPAGYSAMNMAGMMRGAMPGMEAPAEDATDAADAGSAEQPPPKKKWGWKDALDQLK
jgi:hypothetical protein